MKHSKTFAVQLLLSLFRSVFLPEYLLDTSLPMGGMEIVLSENYLKSNFDAISTNRNFHLDAKYTFFVWMVYCVSDMLLAADRTKQ